MIELYFGCVETPGHFFFVPSGVRYRSKVHKVDTFIPFEKVDAGNWRSDIEFEAFLFRHDSGWTMLSFADYSIDKRKGSHSTFIVQAVYAYDEMVEWAKTAFPSVWARFKCEPFPAERKVPRG